MGRRRSRRKPPPKTKLVEQLPSNFACPFCNHEHSCEGIFETYPNPNLKVVLVKMDRARSVGSVKCNVCMEEFQTTINYLSETVDVYADWIDACEKANE